MTHRFKSRTEPGGYKLALENVTFSASPGRVTGLFGPNGAGKTTAMKLLFGLLRPQSGKVLWAGEAITYRQRRQFGYMPERRSLYESMRVTDQLVYFARHHGLSRKAAQQAVGDWLERLDISELGPRPLGSLSLGQQQRAQLVAAFAHDPKLVVLDEPFSGLDLLAVDIVAETLPRRHGRRCHRGDLQPPARRRRTPVQRCHHPQRGASGPQR